MGAAFSHITFSTGTKENVRTISFTPQKPRRFIVLLVSSIFQNQKHKATFFLPCQIYRLQSNNAIGWCRLHGLPPMSTAQRQTMDCHVHIGTSPHQALSAVQGDEESGASWPVPQAMHIRQLCFWLSRAMRTGCGDLMAGAVAGVGRMGRNVLSYYWTLDNPGRALAPALVGGFENLLPRAIRTVRPPPVCPHPQILKHRAVRRQKVVLRSVVRYFVPITLVRGDSARRVQIGSKESIITSILGAPPTQISRCQS